MDTRALLDLGDRLLIGTYRSGLWVLKAGLVEPEPNDFLTISESNRDVFALASLNDEVLLIGTSGTSGLSHSGLWTWLFGMEAQGWSATTDVGFRWMCRCLRSSSIESIPAGKP